MVQPYKVDDTLSMTANLKRFIKERQWDSHTFGQVNVIMASERFTLMPLEYFEDEQAEAIFHYNLSPRENEEVHYNILPKCNVVVLFGMDRSACHYLNEQLGNVSYYAQSSPLIEWFVAESRQDKNGTLYAHLRLNGMEVYALHQGALLLANSQACGHTADRLYYLLYLWKQLELDAEHDSLYLCGAVREKEQLLTQLRKFIRKVQVLNPSENLDFKNLSSCE